MRHPIRLRHAVGLILSAAILLVSTSRFATAQIPVPLDLNEVDGVWFGGPVAPLPLPDPVELTPTEQGRVDTALVDWEKSQGNIVALTAAFTRMEFNGLMGPAPARPVRGKICYVAPHHGSYELDDGSEKWQYDGNSICDFRFDLKKVNEHRLPEQWRLKPIIDGPLTFLYGIDVARMKRRFWWKVITPTEESQGRIWLEAVPRTFVDARVCKKVQLILDGSDHHLFAMNVISPNERDRTVFVFDKIVDRRQDLPVVVEEITAATRVPAGWQQEVIGRSPAIDPAK